MFSRAVLWPSGWEEASDTLFEEVKKLENEFEEDALRALREQVWVAVRSRDLSRLVGCTLFLMCSNNTNNVFLFECRRHAFDMCAKWKGDWTRFVRECRVEFLLTYGDEFTHMGVGVGERVVIKGAGVEVPFFKPPTGPNDKYALSQIACDDQNDAVRVVNFVATFDACASLSVKHMILNDPNIFSLSLQSGCAMCRFDVPKSTTLLFCSGKTISVAARSRASSLLSAWRHISLLRSTVCPTASVAHWTVSNITSTFRLPGAFNVVAYQRAHPDVFDTKFDLTMFPGLTIRCHEFKSVLLVFMQGSVNVTGCRKLEDVHGTVKCMLPRLMPFVLFTDAEIQAAQREFDAAKAARPSTKELKRRREE